MCFSAELFQERKKLAAIFGADFHWDSWDIFKKREQQDPKRFPPIQGRVFPESSYGAVVVPGSKKPLVLPARYGAYLKPELEKNTPQGKRYTTYNARMDNLQAPFWSHAFLKNHGCVALESFYEWVQVSHVIEAGAISLKVIEKQFAEQSLERKHKILAAGKRYTLTAAEKKPLLERKIQIHFTPKEGGLLFVPCILSTKILEDGREDWGFAIVTHDPPFEVAAAGHERCPVFLNLSGALGWLDAQGATPQIALDQLAQRNHVVLCHGLAESA